jgi:hypothetical protein
VDADDAVAMTVFADVDDGTLICRTPVTGATPLPAPSSSGVRSLAILLVRVSAQVYRFRPRSLPQALAFAAPSGTSR